MTDQSRTKKMKEKKQLLIIGISAFVIIALIMVSKPKEIPTITGEWDITEEAKQNNYDIYLVEESDFDYSDPVIQQKAKEIKQSTGNPDDAIKETIRYVVKRVRYSSAVTVADCVSETASSVMQTGLGDCVSMSRLVTALLRAQGIPARTRGGCLSSSIRCGPVFAVVPGEDFKVTAMTEGDFKKRGFLHEWVEAWTPSGWILLEATSGQAFDMECATYLPYAYDTNNIDRCVISSNTFWNTCRGY